MHFTREPILESIISAREGQKISIRKSSIQANETAEEFIVDSVEVVSFGGNLFFRSLEKPKPFLLPVSHYELIEVKETRIVLKSATLEKSIKIGGGKEQPPKAVKEVIPAEAIAEEMEEGQGEEAAQKQENVQHSVQMEPTRGGDRKRDRRKRRRGREGREEREWQERQPQQAAPVHTIAQEEAPRQAIAPSQTSTESGSLEASNVVPPVIPFATLIPPPTTLISETLSRYKEVMFGEMNTAKTGQTSSQPEDTFIQIEEVIYEEKKPEADENNASDEPLTRVRIDETYFDKGGFGQQF